MKKEKNYVIKNTIYCIKYIWEIDRKYILLMIVISILTSLFNIINLSILRYITETIAMQEMRYFLMIIGVMLLVSIVIAIINGSASYLYEPLLQNRIIEKIQGDIYAKAKTFNLEEYDNEEFYDLYYFVAENGKTGILNAITLITGILTSLMSVIGISSIILQYDFLVISCAFIGVGISCMCSIRMKNLQYKFKIESIPYNREINYIHRIFYLHEYIKEIITFSNSRVFEKKYQAAWSGMNRITNKWGKRIRMQYIGIMLIDSITEIFILIYLGYNTIFGKIPIGEFIVLYTGIQQMIQQMKAAIASVPEIYSNALDLGFAAIEGMAAGCPVLLSKVSGFDEIPDGIGQVEYFYPGNIDMLTQKIQILLEDEEKRKRIAESGRRSVEKRFSMNKFGEDVIQVYKNLNNNKESS